MSFPPLIGPTGIVADGGRGPCAEHELTDAIESDLRATSYARAKHSQPVAAALRRGLAAKHKAYVISGSLATRRCEVTKQFKIFAIPEGYSGSFSDVFPHGIPKNAKGITVSFVDGATGKAQAAEAFPGQTWSSQVKGFTADGRLDVRVNLSGTGFGKPDENSKAWTVVVYYDC